jgi:hypothetical protein
MSFNVSVEYINLHKYLCPKDNEPLSTLSRNVEPIHKTNQKDKEEDVNCYTMCTSDLLRVVHKDNFEKTKTKENR